MRAGLLLIIPIYFFMWLYCFGHAIAKKNVLGILLLFFTNPLAPLLYLIIFHRGN